MLKRPKINLSGVDDLLKDSEIKNTIDLSGVDDELKKKGSTVPNIKSDSEITTGSSDGKGFPKIDTNSVAPGMGVQPNGIVAKKEKKGKIVDYKKPKEDSSFFDYLKENLDTGLATVSKSIYDAPGMVYDYAALITNPIAEVFGADKSQLASSDKLAKDLGFRNIPSETLKKKIAESNEKINAYSINNGGDALSALENGNYSGAAKMIAGTTVQSLPIMAAAMLSGGSAGAMTAIGVSTASTKNAELKDEHPEISMGTRLKNAATSGVLEATLGHLFTGASGGVIKKILADKGVEAGSRIISNSFRSTIEKSIAKSPLAGAFGEMVEESAVEFGNQLNDIDSGIRTEFDVRAIKNAGISAMGMGGVNTVAVYGAKGYIKAKDYNALKSVNKEIDKLSTQLTNENISPENKEIISSRIDRLVTENKRILGTELEKLKSLPAEVKSELNTINNNLSEIRSKADDIKEDNSIDPEIKEKLLHELNIQSKNAGKRKIEILNSTNDVAINADFSNFEGVEPDFNLENGKISSLPLKEQDRLNKLAVEQITGGDKTIEYTKEQVSQTANEIYKNEQTPTTPEAQPQAEADKVAPHPVEDVVAPSVENIKNNGLKISGVTSIEFEDNNETILYGTKNNRTRISIKGMSKEQIQEEYDFDKQVFDKNKSRDFEAEEIEIKKSVGLTNNEKISALKELKSSKRYNDILENITLPFYETKLNEKQSNPNTPTNGNLPIGANNVGENGITKSETPNAESVPSAVDGGENKGDAEVSDLDHAKSQIDKGVLNWNGDTGAERVNLGIPWADIRKGEKDIKAGKLNTVPAKRLIEALKTAKEKGGYEYVQGAGGQMKKQFVSLEDIQRANNEYELTDAEQKEVDAKEAELSNEYELYFGGLDLETQNDIYENREGIKGMGEEPATSGKSKNDVPNKESEQNSGAKEKTALEKAQEARRAAKAKLVAKRQNLSIASDPKQDAQDLYDYHQALVTEAKEHIKIGVKSLADFAKELGEKVSISIKTAWQEANGEISPITNGEDLGYDFNTVDDEVKANDFKAESEPKPDMEAFRDSWNKEPSSDEINQYDSGRTINREHGELRNNQNYEVQKDLARVQIGIKAIEHAKELFGAEYVEKTLSFIEQANLSPEKKAVAYVLLENEMDARAKEFPDNVGVKKLQDLVRAKSQAFLANSARAMGAGRFRIERFRELAKNGFSEEEFTNAILTTKQIKDKEKIQKLSQVTPDDINAEADRQESHVVDSDLEQLISEGVEKQLNEIYKKLPTSRRVRADKAISALENIQKKLRGKAYDATIGVPIAIIDSGITIIKNSIKAGVNIADAIEIGINHIKSKYGKDWKKEDDFRKDMRDGFEEEGVNVKDKAPKEISQEQKAKDLVKKALIDAGFSREITVRNKNGKEKRNVLDWKKLAGEAGTIDNIRKNVEESLKNSDYSKSEIEAMKDALEKEYVRLTADVIEKGLNELQNRNAPRKPINTKSAARKLAELHNYGLFEESKDSYEKIINSVLGLNELDQKAHDEMKHIAKGYAVLFDSGLSETETKDAINTLSRRQSRLVAMLSFSQADWRFKLSVALSEITNLATRFKLVNLGNLTENISSGMMARASNRMIDAMANIKKGEKTSNKALRNQSKTNARAKLKGITLEASESYGDTSSLLLNHSAVEDYFNNSTTNKVYHAIISTYMAKPVLEGADSFNKILITEAKMVRATIKVLQAKGMTNKDALDYVAKALTGESMKEAIVKSKNLILEVNNKSGKKLLNDSESSVQSLASDIVKESLVSGGQITETELKAIYNAAYKSAGKDIGHVSNNWVTDQISAKGAHIEKKVADAIKEKKWGVAAGHVINQIIWKNGISTFVGGGTNWFVKGLQKSANPLSLLSLRDDAMHLKMAGDLDITTDEGIKNMEEALYRGMNLRSTAGSMVMGAVITASIIGSMMATGADDELAEWLKKNPWAKKFHDKLVPDAVVLMLAIKDKDYGRYIAKTINVKADFFDEHKNIAEIFKKYAEGYDEDDAYKTAKASGDLGAMLGKRFDFPGPLRAVKDAKQIYKGAVKGKYDETDYYTSGFLNGFFQGGIVEGLGLRKDPTLENKKSTKGIMEGRLHPKRKTAEEKRESRRTREENERELMKKAREEGVRYVPPRR